MAAKRPAKSLVALRNRYYDGAKAIVEGFGGTLVNERDTGGSVGPCADYDIQTDCGRLRVHVYQDWTATAFDRPKLAAARLGRFEVSRGKWNHHCWPLSQGKPTAEIVDEHLAALRMEFERVGARAFVAVATPISSAEVDASDIEQLRDREAMGEIFVIDGFDKEAAAEEVSSQATDSEGNRPDWLVRSSRDHMLSRSDLEAYATLRDWRAHRGDAAPRADAVRRAP